MDGWILSGRARSEVSKKMLPSRARSHVCCTFDSVDSYGPQGKQSNFVQKEEDMEDGDADRLRYTLLHLPSFSRISSAS